MLPVKQIVGFLARLLVFYGLLAFPWPGLREAYSAAYQAAGDAVFGSFGRDGVVRFEALPHVRGQMDTEIVFGNRRTRPAPRAVRHSARLTGYLPTAEVLALILATPIPWSRKWKALLWGLVLVHGLVAIRVLIALLHHFSGDHPCALYSPSPFWMVALTRVYKVTVVWVSFTFVAPLFIWILVAFRRADLVQWYCSWQRPAPDRSGARPLAPTGRRGTAG